MINVKQAVAIAVEKSLEMLGSPGKLEEIERDDYRGRDTWSITLSWPKDRSLAPTSLLGVPAGWDPLEYKRFLIDVQTGEFVAMKLRELASQ
jgi:hypothetical protein